MNKLIFRNSNLNKRNFKKFATDQEPLFRIYLGTPFKNGQNKEYCECGSYVEAYIGTKNKLKRLNTKTVCHEPTNFDCRKNDAYKQMKSNFTVKIEDRIIQLISDTETITIEDTDFTDDDKIQNIVKSELK